MLAFFAATCLSNTDPYALLEANRKAMAAPASGTLDQTYRFSSEGMDGVSISKIDLSSGNYVERHSAGLSTDAEGFDGVTPWMQDLSGFYSPQTGGNKEALAVDRAYRNANLWWRRDRSRATIKAVDCNSLEVTPQGGQPFRASFDPSTHLLSSIRELHTFGHVHETRYADYRRCGPALVPARIETVSDGDPATLQVSVLAKCSMDEAVPPAKFAMPKTRPNDWRLPQSGIASLAMRTRDPEVMIKAKINGKGPFLFYLDSGGHDIISPRLAHELGIRIEGSGRSGGAGEKTVETGYVRVASINAGGAVLRNQKVAVIETSPPKVVGELIGGVLGVEFFERFVTTIDYAANKVIFEDPRRFGPAERAAAGTAVPFRFYEHMPQVSGRFEDIPARFNIDTGASDTLTLTGLRRAREPSLALPRFRPSRHRIWNRRAILRLACPGKQPYAWIGRGRKAAGQPQHREGGILL